MNPVSLRRPLVTRAVALLLAAVLVACVALMAPLIFKGIDERSGDWAWRLGAGSEPERRLLIVDIDDNSLARLGAWPWSRAQVAELLRKIQAMDAGAVALDIAFPEARPGDAELGQVIRDKPVVLAQILALEGSTIRAGQLQDGAVQPACSPASPIASGYIGNSPALQAAAGHITPEIAADGSVRHLPALICHDGKTFPSLGLALLKRAVASDQPFHIESGQGWLAPAYRLTHPQLPGISVPLDDHGRARISYRREREAFMSVSASDVLEGRAPAHAFKGALVIVGATAFGLGDAVPTPHGGAVSGVEVHAQFLTGMLDGRTVATPSAHAVIQSGLALLCAALLLATSLWSHRCYRSAWAMPLTGLVLACALLGLHTWALLAWDLWLGWATPASFCLLGGVLLAIVEHATVRFERERLYKNLAAYLPEPVAARIALSEVTGVIEAERREVTVLFADIRNFSAYCEGRPPEEAAAILHVFFTTAARVVKAHGGVIEEFVGDAIMAVWNAPIACGDHPYQAYQAACELLEQCRPLFPDTAPDGLEPLALGIGLETGQALVGSFGPTSRRTHGALGDTVTIAARLTALTGDLAQPLLVGESAADHLLTQHPDLELIHMGAFLLEGLRKSYKIFASRMPLV